MRKLFGLLVSLSIAVFVVFSTDLEDWNTYKLKYGKNYPNQTEDKIRMEIFLKNKHKIDEHNEKHANGSVSFTMGLNNFSDLTRDELNAQMKGLLRSTELLGSTQTGNETIDRLFDRHHHRHRHHHNHHRNNTFYDYLPNEIDWRNEGAVNEVKTKMQGVCGACWAFSTTGAIEGQYFRKTGKLVQLSEQNLIDCTDRCGCNGCTLSGSYLYALINGIDLADQYPTPYSAIQGVCQFNNTNAIKITDVEFIPAGDENKLREAIATIGPISVEINANHDSFYNYRSGVYYEPECNAHNLDHGVLAVGYGTTEKGEDYYIVKNWWGDDWGEKGYFKLARNRNNHCGIATAAKYPRV